MRSNPKQKTKAEKLAALNHRFNEDKKDLIEAWNLFKVTHISRDEFTQAFFAIIHEGQTVNLDSRHRQDKIRKGDFLKVLQAFRYCSLNQWSEVNLNMINKVNQVVKMAKSL